MGAAFEVRARVVFVVVALLVAGCHGTDLRLGTGRTNGEGSASGELGGYHGGSFDVETGDATSVWAELGFQLTPQTVVVKRSDEHYLEPPYPPADYQPPHSRGDASVPRVAVSVVPADPFPPSVSEPAPGSRSHARLEARVLSLEARVEALEEDVADSRAEGRSGLASIDWTEIIVALIVLLVGGGAAAHQVGRRRRRRRAKADRPESCP